MKNWESSYFEQKKVRAKAIQLKSYSTHIITKISTRRDIHINCLKFLLLKLPYLNDIIVDGKSELLK